MPFETMMPKAAMSISDKVAEHLKEVLGEGSARTRRPTLVDEGAAGSLGPYQLEAVLGAGGMGTVYRATDRATGKPVALKVPHAGPFPFSSRFERESWYASALGQVGDAPYLDHGVTSNGTPFLAMPLLEGGSLAERLRREGALSPGDVLRVGERVAHVLASLHERGLIHRDVKPHNVLVDESGRVWLLDHGLTGSPRTLRGSGTATHAAPEQLEGGEIGPAADVYALGVTMLEAWLGEPVFEDASGRTPEHSPSAKLERVGVRGVRELIRRMLAREPAARPANGAEVARAIARLRVRGAAAGEMLTWRRRGLLGDSPWAARGELAWMDRALHATGRCALAGPPGIGKSRSIATWWTAHAPSGAALCWPEPSVTERPRAAGALARAWLEALAGLSGAESAAYRRSALSELGGAGTAARLSHDFEAGWLAIMGAAAEERPLVLVADHLELPDAVSMRLAEALRARHGERVFLVEELNSARADALVLPPLGPGDLDRLADSVPPGPHRDRALRLCEGNPLAFQAFVIEPAPSIEAALSGRIQRLDAYARWLLRLAALGGATFRAEGLLALAGACDGPILRDGLARLVEARLLIDLTREHGAAAGTYRFAHAQIAQAARAAWAGGQRALGARLWAS